MDDAVRAAPTTAVGRPRRKPCREELKPGENLCTHCRAKCCRYFALPIDIPDTWQEFEYLRWFLLHQGAAVFTEDGDWYLLVYGKCRHLRDDQLCEIYQTRPEICRRYATQDCEYEDTWVHEHYLETPEQVEEYAEAVLGPRRGRGIRSPKPRLNDNGKLLLDRTCTKPGKSGSWAPGRLQPIEPQKSNATRPTNGRPDSCQNP